MGGGVRRGLRSLQSSSRRQHLFCRLPMHSVPDHHAHKAMSSPWSMLMSSNRHCTHYTKLSLRASICMAVRSSCVWCVQRKQRFQLAHLWGGSRCKVALLLTPAVTPSCCILLIGTTLLSHGWFHLAASLTAGYTITSSLLYHSHMCDT